MKDVELRRIVLSKLYEMRSEIRYTPKSADFGGILTDEQIVRACQQLQESDLIKATITNPVSGPKQVLSAEITAKGADAVEQPDLSINQMSHQTINITGSNNIIGNHNQQTVQNSVQELVKVIDSSSATGEEKAEAKGLLKQFLEHPLLAALAGSAMSYLVGL